MHWPQSWCALEDNDEIADALRQELLREVGPGHRLHGLPVGAIGRSDRNDDVLFRVLDGSDRVADVHLTWTRSCPERPPWPLAALHDTFEDWVAAVAAEGPGR